MIIVELSSNDMEYAKRIADEAEMSTIVVSPRSFSSEINEIIQVGVQLASYAIPAVALIIVEALKNKKRIKIKITNSSFEAEGREQEVLALARLYIEQNKEKEASKIVEELLQDGKTK